MNIKTKYLPPTNTKGARIKATCELGTATISYPYELSGDACHQAAVDALMKKFKTLTQYRWIIGARPGLPPFAYALNMRDARKLQKIARRLGLTGSITKNGGNR